MPVRSVRIPDEVWDEARRIAADNGETISDVILRCLIRYVRDWPTDR